MNHYFTKIESHDAICCYSPYVNVPLVVLCAAYMETSSTLSLCSTPATVLTHFHFHLATNSHHTHTIPLQVVVVHANMPNSHVLRSAFNSNMLKMACHAMQIHSFRSHFRASAPSWCSIFGDAFTSPTSSLLHVVPFTTSWLLETHSHT